MGPLFENVNYQKQMNVYLRQGDTISVCDVPVKTPAPYLTRRRGTRKEIGVLTLRKKTCTATCYPSKESSGSGLVDHASRPRRSRPLWIITPLLLRPHLSHHHRSVYSAIYISTCSHHSCLTCQIIKQPPSRPQVWLFPSSSIP